MFSVTFDDEPSVTFICASLTTGFGDTDIELKESDLAKSIPVGMAIWLRSILWLPVVPYSPCFMVTAAKPQLPTTEDAVREPEFPQSLLKVPLNVVLLVAV